MPSSVDLGHQLEKFVSSLVSAGGTTPRARYCAKACGCSKSARSALLRWILPLHGAGLTLPLAAPVGRRCAQAPGCEVPQDEQVPRLKVIFSEKAERDLEEIADWIARDNPERARTFVAELVKAAKSIGRAPRAYPFVDKGRDPHLRRRVHRNYLIFFDIGLEAVEVLHVVHGARDYAQIVFANEQPD